MKRREFITGLGGAAAWPSVARAQQPTLPVIGFLNGQSPDTFSRLAASFREGLSETGHIEGQNIAIEYRWAEGQPDRLSSLAADLVRRQVAVIVASGGNNSALVAKTATAKIPIVFLSNDDPRKYGLVASLNRPGGNITGVTWFSAEIGSKRLATLHEMIPDVKTVALLLNPNNSESTRQPAELEEAAHSLGLQILVLKVTSATDIDSAFQKMVEQRVGAFVVAGDSFLLNRHEQIIALAERHAIPAIYVNREMASNRGLMSYGNSLTDAYRRAGICVGQILKGATPAELPVDQATKFELVINLKTAKILGLDVPSSLLARADEVIE